MNKKSASLVIIKKITSPSASILELLFYFMCLIETRVYNSVDIIVDKLGNEISSRLENYIPQYAGGW